MTRQKPNENPVSSQPEQPITRVAIYARVSTPLQNRAREF
jgi:hypothetical protein